MASNSAKTTLKDLLGALRGAFGQRRRRVWVGRSRAHVECRELSQDELSSLRERLEILADKAPGIEWVELNPHTRRIVLAFENGALDEDAVLELVHEAERGAQVQDAPYSDGSAPHPADDEDFERLLVELASDVTGLVVGAGLRVSPFRPSSVAGTLAAVTSILRGSPRLRRELDERWGRDRAELGLNFVAAASYGFSQRPVSSLVDVAHKLALIRESRAQKRVWEAREPELCERPTDHDLKRSEPRPVPLPRGPIEEYADRAWLVSLAGFGVSFLTTRSVQRAVAALFGGIPKPARLGRDVFSSELSRALAARRVLVLDSDVLRRLDRIDCIVLQGDLVARGRFEIGEIVTNPEVTAQHARELVGQLLEPEQPVEVRREDAWALGPPRLLGAKLDDELAQHAEGLSRRGALVLGLARDGEVRAVVELRIVPQTGVEELIAAAHEAQMRVVVASDDEAVLQGLNADDTISAAAGLASGIRRLQREGRAVLLVATGNTPGLAAADVTIGLTRGSEPAPWGAHLVCSEDLSDVRFVLQACVTSKRVSKQSVNVALGAATVGTLISAGGVIPMTTRRIIGVVNVATLIAMVNGMRNSSVLERRALPPPRDRTPWHALEAHGVLERLGSSVRGLSRGEASFRGGPGRDQPSALAELGEAVTDELFNPLAPLLAAGAGLSAVVGSLADAGMVGGVVGLNALVGGVQRFTTERAIRDLSRTTRRAALVRRGGEVRQVDAARLVRGDVVLLSSGDMVPADCRVLEAESLEVDASSLTGESMPVKKTATPSFEREIADRASMLYEGTSIAAGRATAVVVAAGEETEARRGGPGPVVDPKNTGVEQRLSSLIDLNGSCGGVGGSRAGGSGSAARSQPERRDRHGGQPSGSVGA